MEEGKVGVDVILPSGQAAKLQAKPKRKSRRFSMRTEKNDIEAPPQPELEKTKHIRENLDKIEENMKSNIERAVARGENIESLEEKMRKRRWLVVL